MDLRRISHDRQGRALVGMAVLFVALLVFLARHMPLRAFGLAACLSILTYIAVGAVSLKAFEDKIKQNRRFEILLEILLVALLFAIFYVLAYVLPGLEMTPPSLR